jgi:D-3-phosphoglycerate dehydrogenase
LSNNKFNIFAADKIHPSGLQLLKNKSFIVFKLYGMSNSELIQRISKIDSLSKNKSALIVRSVRNIRKRDIDQLKLRTKIKYICTASSGFDNIDYIYAKYLGFKVINVPAGNFISAAEHTLALILNITKRLSKSSLNISEKSFKFEYNNSELYLKTIGIIGVGRVGSHIAKLCKSFGMKILGNDIKPNLSRKYPWIYFCNLNFLLKNSDIVTVHTPLDDSTLDLLNKDNLRLLKHNAVIINCARGSIINEKALINLLKQRKNTYAGFDVFDNEPTIRSDFKKLNNIVLTPHQAGKTVESRLRISLKLANKLIKEFKV